MIYGADTQTRRRIALLVSSIALLAMGLAAFAYTGYQALSSWALASTRAVAEFDEGEEKTLEWDEHATPLVLMLVVDSIDEQLPAMDVHVRTIDGGEAQASHLTGWAGFFGRSFRRVLRMEPNADRTPLVISVDVTDPNAVKGRADFAVFQDPETLFNRYQSRMTPWWIAGGALALGSVVCLLAAALWRRSPDPFAG